MMPAPAPPTSPPPPTTPPLLSSAPSDWAQVLPTLVRADAALLSAHCLLGLAPLASQLASEYAAGAPLTTHADLLVLALMVAMTRLRGSTAALATARELAALVQVVALAIAFRGADGGFDTLLMRNFLVDISNRPLLFLGGLSRDLLNAPPLAVLPAEQQVCE